MTRGGNKHVETCALIFLVLMSISYVVWPPCRKDKRFGKQQELSSDNKRDAATVPTPLFQLSSESGRLGDPSGRGKPAARPRKVALDIQTPKRGAEGASVG